MYIKSFALILFCIAAEMSNAQMTIDSDGRTKFDKNVAIGTSADSTVQLKIYHLVSGTTQPNYGINSNLQAASSAPVGNCYAIHGHADVSSYYAGSESYLGNAFGVWGEVTNNSTNASDIFCAGVVGVANRSYANGGIGVLGSIHQGPYAFPTSGGAGLYAGFFYGPVRVTSNVSAASFTTTSDVRLKQGIELLSTNEAHNAIMQLSPISYYFKQDKDSTQYVFGDDSKAMETKHYGLIAQEIQQILPNLVYENCDGYLSINYTELIPLLIREIQELHEELDLLKQNKTFKVSSNMTDLDNNELTQASLYQNTPNPFTHNTTIKYVLPADTREASIHIYDMNGTEIVAFSIDAFGKGEVNVDGGTLRAGMYLYSLIADGQLIDTKQMILTK